MVSVDKPKKNKLRERDIDVGGRPKPLTQELSSTPPPPCLTATIVSEFFGGVVCKVPRPLQIADPEYSAFKFLDSRGCIEEYEAGQDPEPYVELAKSTCMQEVWDQLLVYAREGEQLHRYEAGPGLREVATKERLVLEVADALFPFSVRKDQVEARHVPSRLVIYP